MRKFLLLLTLLPFLSYGQKTILWKITDSHSSTVSYLLGTNHVVRNSFVDKYPVIADRIGAADVVITETSLDPENMATRYSSRPGSDAISSLLSKEDFNYVNEIINRGRTKVDASKLTPGELVLKLGTSYVTEKCMPKNGTDSLLMDKYIQYLGKSRNKELFFLETDSFQLQTISQLANQYDTKFFKGHISALLKSFRSKKINKYTCELYNRYVSLDFDYKLKEPMKTTTDGMDNVLLIKSRNDSWVSKLAPLLATRNCFVAVGLYHLYYNTGLIQQLRDKGYTIEPIDL